MAAVPLALVSPRPARKDSPPHLRCELWRRVAWLGLITLLLGCGRPENSTAAKPPANPVVRVRTATLEPGEDERLLLTGIVRARTEVSLAFQVPGRIAERHADAGQTVSADQVLLRLEDQDYREQLHGAEAQVRAAEIEAALAESDLERLRQLLHTRVISPQEFDRGNALARAARERLSAARSALVLASNHLAYTRLVAPCPGRLIEVSGEPGQVVAAGQPVAQLAAAGACEVEVALPQSLAAHPPRRGEARLGSEGSPVLLELRELAGAADPVSRTWRARYRLPAEVQPPLGVVVQVALERLEPPPPRMRIPVSALDERGEGPRVWTIEAARAVPHPVRISAVGDTHALIQTELPAGTRVIASGTHLLEAGQAVEALRP